MCVCAQAKGACIYICAEIINCDVFIFLWSLFILFFSFFVWEKIKRFDEVFLSFWGQKKTKSSFVQKVAAFEREKKLDSFFFTRMVLYIKPLYRHTVGVQKGRRRLFDDDDALSSV